MGCSESVEQESERDQELVLGRKRVKSEKQKIRKKKAKSRGDVGGLEGEDSLDIKRAATSLKKAMTILNNGRGKMNNNMQCDDDSVSSISSDDSDGQIGCLSPQAQAIQKKHSSKKGATM
mmetsp:Transcript_22555/g.22383  ORF Transcript_22555/g.22383 Transcript_22555/m.22383 type:complete len:120 (+) Transcript_22555:47-406(+)